MSAQALLLDSEGMTSELALGYTSFAQVCRVLGLQAQTEFIRGLWARTVVPILQQYTKELGVYEVKMLIHRREVPMFGGMAKYYEIKRLWPATKGSNNGGAVNMQHWLFCCTLLEQAGWLWASPLTLCDDRVVVAMYHPSLGFNLKGQAPLYRGLMLVNSEAGLYPSRWLPLVAQPDAGYWIPVGDVLQAEALQHDLEELLDGRISMFGVCPHLRQIDTSDSVQRLQAYASVVLSQVAGSELLMKAGLTRSEAIEAVAACVRDRQSVTGYNLIVAQIQEQLRAIEADPWSAFQRVIKLGLALWE